MSHLFFGLLMLFSLMSFFLRSPWQYAMWLVPTSFIAGAAMSSFTVKKWLMFSLFLVFVGGVMTVLLYISSLGAPSLFVAPSFYSLPIVFLIILCVLPNIFLAPYNLKSSFLFFSNSSFLFLSAMGGFLLVILLACVDRVEAFKGPLKTFAI